MSTLDAISSDAEAALTPSLRSRARGRTERTDGMDWTSILFTMPRAGPGWVTLPVHYLLLVGCHLALPQAVWALGMLCEAGQLIVVAWLAVAPPAVARITWSGELSPDSNPALLITCVIALLELLLALVAYRLMVGPLHLTSAADVARLLLRTMAVLMLPVCMLLALPERFTSSARLDWIMPIAIAIVAGVLVSMPALLLRRMQARGVRPRAWRPVCAECGQSARRAASPRCPECGCEFAGPTDRDRRWAVRRVALDRGRFGWAPVRAFRTAFHASLWPGDFGDRVAIPDRLGRATWFACACAGLTVFIVNPWLFMLPAHWVIVYFFGFGNPLSFRLLWYMNEGGFTAILWIFVVLSIPLSVATLVCVWPFPNPTARAIAWKWSLYSMGMLPFAAIVCWTAALYFWSQINPAATWPLADSLRQYGSYSAVLASMAFSVFWALGMGRNRYLRRRGAFVTLGFAIAYMVCWWLICTRLIPIGPLWRAL